MSLDHNHSAVSRKSLIVLVAIAVLSTSCPAQESPLAGGQRPGEVTIWTWNFQSVDGWRVAMKSSNLINVQKTTTRLNAESVRTGRVYQITSGEVPVTVPAPPRNSPVAQLRPQVVRSGEPASNTGKAIHSATAKHFSALKPSGKVELLSDVRHAFGVIVQDTPAAHVFKIRNAGKSALKIHVAGTSCGCTSVRINGVEQTSRPIIPTELNTIVPIPEIGTLPLPVLPASHISAGLPQVRLPDLPQLTMHMDQGAQHSANAAASPDYKLPAGKTADIEVSVTTGNTHGTIKQHVQLATSDPDHSMLELIVEGEVVPQIELSSAWLQLSSLRTDRSTHESLQVTTRFLPNFQIEHAFSSNSAVKVRVEPIGKDSLERTKARVGYDIRVDIPAGQPIGPLDGDLTLLTNLADQPTLTIPLFGFVEGDVTLYPTHRIDFGVVPQQSGASSGIYAKVQTSAIANFRVRKVAPEFLDVKLHTQAGLDNGKQFVIIEASVLANSPSGSFAGVVELESTHPTSKMIRIPVQGHIESKAAD